MSKIMVIGDPHLKTSNIKSVEVFFGWILDIVRIQKPDSIVYLGDMFHTHNIVRSEIMTLVTKHIKELTKSVPCYILLGNHDLAHPKTPDIHAWIPFMQGYDNLYIIDKLIFVDGNCYLPYIDSQDEFQIELDKAMSSSDLIFCHQTFRDANFGFITKSAKKLLKPLIWKQISKIPGVVNTLNLPGFSSINFWRWSNLPLP